MGRGVLHEREARRDSLSCSAFARSTEMPEVIASTTLASCASAPTPAPLRCLTSDDGSNNLAAPIYESDGHGLAVVEDVVLLRVRQ